MTVVKYLRLCFGISFILAILIPFSTSISAERLQKTAQRYQQFGDHRPNIPQPREKCLAVRTVLDPDDSWGLK